MIPKSSSFISIASIFLLLILAAIVLRFTTIAVGLYAEKYPDFHYDPDENGNMMRALRIGEGRFDVQYVSPLFFYVLFVFYAAVISVFVISGQTSLAGFKEYFFLNPDKFLLAGKLFVSFLGSLAVGLVYLVGSKIFSKKVGLIAGVLLLFSFGHFVISTEVHPDTFFSIFYILAIYLLYLILKNPGKGRFFVLGGSLAGLAASTKTNGLSLLAPFGVLFLALLLRQSSPGKIGHLFKEKEKILKLIFLFAIAFVTTFIIFSSPSLLSGEVKRFSGLISSPSFGSLCYQTPYQHSLWFYITTILPRMVSWPVLVLLFISTIMIPLFQKKGWVSASLALVTIYSYLLPMGWYTRASWRDAIPIIALIYLVVSYFLDSLLGEKRAFLLLVCTGLLLILPVKNIYNHTRLLRHPDTRELSKAWVEKNIEAGARIAIERYGPPLKRSKEAMLRQWKTDDDIVRVYLKHLDEAEITYNIFIFSDFLSEQLKEIDENIEQALIKYLKENEIDYLILSSRAYSRWFAPAAEVHVERQIVARVRNFYQAIEDRLDLIKEFVPDAKTAPGPVIKIYRVPDRIEHFQSRRTFEPYLRDGDGTVGYYWH